MGKYAIEVLEKEKYILTACLSDWDLQQYPEARKERENRLKDIEESLKLLS